MNKNKQLDTTQFLGNWANKSLIILNHKKVIRNYFLQTFEF